MAGKHIHEMKTQQLLEYCVTPRASTEMMEHIGLTNMRSFRSSYLIPLQEAGLLRKTNPDMPTWRHQKYITVTEASAQPEAVPTDKSDVLPKT